MPRTFSHKKVKASADGGSVETSYFTDGSFVKRQYDSNHHYITVLAIKAVAPR